MGEELKNTTWEDIETLSRESVVLRNFLILVRNNLTSKEQALLDMVRFFTIQNINLNQELVKSKMREMPEPRVIKFDPSTMRKPII